MPFNPDWSALPVLTLLALPSPFQLSGSVASLSLPQVQGLKQCGGAPTISLNTNICPLENTNGAEFSTQMSENAKANVKP